jgi:hypothetical protein
MLLKSIIANALAKISGMTFVNWIKRTGTKKWARNTPRLANAISRRQGFRAPSQSYVTY